MRIFISSSSKDNDYGMKLKDLLTNIVGDNNDLFSFNYRATREDIDQSVFDAIANADIIIPMLSENYFSSRLCLIELGMICSFKFKNKKKILPVYIYPTNPEDVLSNTPLAYYMSYDLTNPASVKALLDIVIPDITISDDEIKMFSHEIQEIVVVHNAIYSSAKDIQVYSYGTNLIVKNWSDYVTYHKSNDKNEIEVSYNLNPYDLKNPRKPEFISLVLKYYSSLDLYSFIRFNDNARVLFKIDNSNNAIDEMDVELKGSLGRYIGKPASFKIKEGINDCEIKLLDFKSNQLKEIDEICFVLRPEHSIGNKGTFVIKDLRISIY